MCHFVNCQINPFISKGTVYKWLNRFSYYIKAFVHDNKHWFNAGLWLSHHWEMLYCQIVVNRAGFRSMICCHGLSVWVWEGGGGLHAHVNNTYTCTWTSTVGICVLAGVQAVYVCLHYVCCNNSWECVLVCVPAVYMHVNYIVVSEICVCNLLTIDKCTYQEAWHLYKQLTKSRPIKPDNPGQCITWWWVSWSQWCINEMFLKIILKWCGESSDWE